jgi:hypothetical protein
VSLLTGSELMVFGKNEKLHDMKISLSSHLDVLHPASLIWNVLSRLELLFHVRHDTCSNYISFLHA